MITYTSDRVVTAAGYVGVVLLALCGLGFVVQLSAGAYTAWADALDRTCLVSK